MSADRDPPITQLLDRAREGDAAALDELMPLIYDELRRLARSQKGRAGRRAGQPGTESLVHEAYLRLHRVELSSRNRGEFFSLASKAMRSLLVDNARRHGRLKRPDPDRRVELDEGLLPTEQRGEEILAVDQALERLERDDPQLARVVECRFFAGLTVEETAEAIGISKATVKRRWAGARLRLYAELHPEDADPPAAETDPEDR